MCSRVRLCACLRVCTCVYKHTALMAAVGHPRLASQHHMSVPAAALTCTGATGRAAATLYNDSFMCACHQFRESANSTWDCIPLNYRSETGRAMIPACWLQCWQSRSGLLESSRSISWQPSWPGRLNALVRTSDGPLMDELLPRAHIFDLWITKSWINTGIK